MVAMLPSARQNHMELKFLEREKNQLTVSEILAAHKFNNNIYLDKNLNFSSINQVVLFTSTAFYIYQFFVVN